MATKEEVQSFLKQFHTKLQVYQIIYRDDRGKNRETLQKLELIPAERTRIIKTITTDDYVDGPIVDQLYKIGDMWVFGKDVKGHEIYIKISLGLPNNSTICISFHIAEHPLRYAFK